MASLTYAGAGVFDPVARRAAGYSAKYVSKSFDADEPSRSLRLHRYEVARGFQPEVVRFSGDTSQQSLIAAVEQMRGVLPSVSWPPSEVEGWQRPPAVWFGWD